MSERYDQIKTNLKEANAADQEHVAVLTAAELALNDCVGLPANAIGERLNERLAYDVRIGECPVLRTLTIEEAKTFHETGVLADTRCGTAYTVNMIRRSPYRHAHFFLGRDKVDIAAAQADIARQLGTLYDNIANRKRLLSDRDRLDFIIAADDELQEAQERLETLLDAPGVHIPVLNALWHFHSTFASQTQGG